MMKLVGGSPVYVYLPCLFFFQAEDGIRDDLVTGVQTCALPIWIVFVQPGAARLNENNPQEIAMQDGRTTLSKFLIDTLDRQPCSAGTMQNAGLSALLIDVAAAIKSISAMLTKGALGGNYGSAHSINTHVQEHKKPDLSTHDIFVPHSQW